MTPSQRHASANVSSTANISSEPRGRVTFPTDKQMDWMEKLMIGVIIVLLVGFVAAISSYFMMVRDAFNDYKNVVKQYHDEKIKQLEDDNNKFRDRLQQLEIKYATLSGQ